MMAWFLVIMSELGILAGFMGQVTASIVFFGIAFMSLTYQNSKITWKWFGIIGDSFDIGATVDHKLTSGVMTFFIMMAIYLVIAVKVGIECAFLPTIQNIIYWAGVIHERNRRDGILLLLLYVLEIILVLLLVIKL